MLIAQVINKNEQFNQLIKIKRINITGMRFTTYWRKYFATSSDFIEIIKSKMLKVMK